MFKKVTRTKNIRRKIQTSDNEDDDGETVSVVAHTKIEKKVKSPAPRSLGLSFDQEEESDAAAFKVKKSKASRRIASGHVLRVPEPLASAQSPSYTSEMLESLRKDTPSLPANLGTTSTLNGDDALLVEKFPGLMKAQVGSTSIPSADAIHAAKKKREQMRKGIVVHEEEDDFVALDDSKENSRLIREEDEIGDDGEGEYEQYVGERLTLNKSAARKLEAERKANARDLIAEAEDDDDDQMEDIERWESELIRHGGVRSQRKDDLERDPFAPPPGYRPAPVPIPTSIPSLDETLQLLDAVTIDLDHNLKEYDTQIEHIKKNRENLETAELDMSNELLRSGERYDYFQQLASYVNDLGEFLDAKFPELESLEKEAHDLIATRHEIVIKRRWEDDIDDLREFARVPENAIKQGEQDDEQDQDQDQDQEGQEQQDGVDEFGRVRELRDSQSAQQRRKAERQKRIASREDFMDLDPSDAIREQGLWSDDEMSEEWVEQRDAKLEAIQSEKVEGILEDVGDEFESLEAVKDKFEAWKTRFYDDYMKAFGSLSLPGAFEFYIRSELVAWDPFSDPVEFDTMRWHNVLSEYGISSEGGDDADTELLNKVVEKIVIKKFKSLLDTLNIASMKEMRYAAQVVEQISYYVEKQDRAYQDLMAAVECAIDKQLKPYADLMDTVIVHSTNDAKVRFFWRQCKYLKTLHVWRRYLSKDSLKSLGSLVMNRILAPILRPSIDPGDAELQREALQLLSRLD